MRHILGVSLCAAALLYPAIASADPVDATLNGGYANLSNGGGDAYSIDGAVEMPFGGNWGAELTGGYHHLTIGGGVDLGNIGGSLYWRSGDFRIAGTVNYMDLSVLHVTSYGVGGEWFASDNFTAALRGGGASGQFGVDGGYFGGDLKYYFTPDIALNAGVDYINLAGFTHVTTEDVRGEWLISQEVPVSLYGGYAHAESPTAGSQDAFFMGVKLYMHGDGATSLVARQRSGNLGYIGGIPYFGQEL